MIWNDKPIVIEAAEEVKKYINRSWDAHKRYFEELEKANSRLKDTTLGTKGHGELRKELIVIRRDLLTDEHNKITNKLNNLRENELNKIKRDRTPITQDDIAELMLLAEVETSQDELEEYVERFKHSTLALRKLREIATKNKMSTMDFPLDREGAANKLFDQLDGTVNYWNNPSAGQTELISMKFVSTNPGEQELSWAKQYNDDYNSPKNKVID